MRTPVMLVRTLTSRPAPKTGPSVLPAALATVLAAAHLTVWTPPARAQVASAPPPRLIVDVEPLLFTQAGYGGALGWRVGPARRWTVAATAFGADLPDVSRDLFFRGADDLDVRLTLGVGLDVRYQLTGRQSGWEAGAVAGAEQFRARAPGGGTESAVNAFVTPHLGYRWHPRGGRFFVYPRAVGIVLIGGGGERVVDGVRYELRPLVPNLQLRVGFTR